MDNLTVGDFWLLFSSIVTIASIIVALTPSKEDDKIMETVLNFLDKLALNVGQVKRRNQKSNP